MRRRARILALVAPLLTGCATATGPLPPPELGYDTVLEPTAVYLLGDTSRVEVDAGGETIEAGVATSAVLALEFQAQEDGVTVSAGFRRFSAHASNPLGSDQASTDESIEGILVFDLDRRGSVTVVAVPDVEGVARRFLTPEAMAVTLFPRLPGRTVRQGDTWTDTIRVDTDEAGGAVAGTSIVTHTVAGDTLVAGRPQLRVEFVGEDQRELTARQSDMEVNQVLSGSSTGWFLWDVGRGVPYESVRESELTGTMEVTEVPFPLSIRVTSRNELRFVEEGEGG